MHFFPLSKFKPLCDPFSTLLQTTLLFHRFLKAKNAFETIWTGISKVVKLSKGVKTAESAFVILLMVSTDT